MADAMCERAGGGSRALIPAKLEPGVTMTDDRTKTAMQSALALRNWAESRIAAGMDPGVLAVAMLVIATEIGRSHVPNEAWARTLREHADEFAMGIDPTFGHDA